MATAISEDISTEVTMLDWKAMLSPSRQSCIKLSNVEPCVNKAVAHLTSLKDRLTEGTTIKNRRPIDTTLQEAQNPDMRKVSSSTNSRLETSKPILVQRDSFSSRLSSGQTSQLMVEGVTTGTPLEKKQSKPKNVRHFVLYQSPFPYCMLRAPNLQLYI